MKLSSMLLCALALGAACGVSTPEDRDPAANTTIAESALSSAAPAAAPDAAPVLGEALFGTALYACHSTVPCPDETFCSEWTGPFACGEKNCNGECLLGEVASLQPMEVYRTCGAGCTEWGQTIPQKTCRDKFCAVAE